MVRKKGLGPLEHQIMDIIWKQKKATVYSVVDELCNEKQLAYTTIMTVMTRLAKKGILTREKKGKTYIYKPKESKKTFIQELVRSTISKTVDMFGAEALAAFVDESEQLSKEHTEKLLSKIDNGN